MIASSLKNLYVATIDGVVRHYPGLQVPESLIHSPVRYQWFVRSVLNPGKIVLTNNRASFSGMNEVITTSRLVDTIHKAVLAADSSKEELRQKILHTIGTDICCPPPPRPLNTTCSARCYLISDQGEIVMSLSDGLDRSRSGNLQQQFPFIYKSLAKHNLLHSRKRTELKKACPTSNHTAEHVNDTMRACMVVKLEAHIEKTNLDRMGGTFGRSSDGNSTKEFCHKGIFYLTSINNTNLFLLTLIDYTSKPCKNEIQKLNQHFIPQIKPLCASQPNYYTSRTNSTTCPKKRFVSIYCRYSSATIQKTGVLFSVSSLAVALLCVVLKYPYSF